MDDKLKAILDLPNPAEGKKVAWEDRVFLAAKADQIVANLAAITATDDFPAVAHEIARLRTNIDIIERFWDQKSCEMEGELVVARRCAATPVTGY